MGATLTLHFQTADGYTADLALDGDKGAGLLAQLPQVLAELGKIGARPCGPALSSPAASQQVAQGNGGNGHGGPAKMGQAGNGLSMRFLPDGSPDPAWCPVHGCEMKRRTKDGQVWYSHKADGAWCRGTWTGVI